MLVLQGAHRSLQELGENISNQKCYIYKTQAQAIKKDVGTMILGLYTIC